jgi:hypothetical protein
MLNFTNKERSDFSLLSGISARPPSVGRYVLYRRSGEVVCNDRFTVEGFLSHRELPLVGPCLPVQEVLWYVLCSTS